MSNIIKQRILFVSDYYQGGGAEIVLHQLMDGFKRDPKSWDISLFYGKKNNERKKGNPLSYIYSFNYLRKLSNKLELFKPDIIHFINYYHILTPSVLDSAAKYKRNNPGVKIIYTAHDFHLLCPNSGLTSFKKGTNTICRESPRRFRHGWAGRKLWFRKWDHRGWFFSSLKLFQWVLAYHWHNKDRVFDRIIAPGKFMYDCLSVEYGSKLVYLIRNPYIAPDVLINKSNQNDEPILKLVFIGRLGQEKGIKTFLQSVPDAAWNSMELHIYGSGPDEEVLKQLIKNSQLESKCFFYGRHPHVNILEQLPLYDALVLPSIWYENTPLTIVEAAFAGLRILCSEWGGVKELASYCGGSYLFNPEDKKSTRDAIDRLKADILSGKPLNRDIPKLKRSFTQSKFINSHRSLYIEGKKLKELKIKALFLDRDGILIEDVVYPHLPEHFHLKQDILPLLRLAMTRGYKLFIMTNQSGIGRGKYTENDFHSFMALLEKEYAKLGIFFTKTYYCPYYKGSDFPEYDLTSENRKPGPGMFLQAALEYNIDLSSSIMIGDKDSDRIKLPELRSIILKGKYPVSEKYDVYDSVSSMIRILGWVER